MSQGGDSDHKKTVQVSSGSDDSLKRGRVDLIQSDFVDLVKQKGYFVKIEKKMFCPCRREMNGSPVQGCVTCKGIGYFFPSEVETRAVMTSITANERVIVDFGALENGLAYMTVDRSVAKVGFMDRVTLRDAESVHYENIYPQIQDSVLIGLLTYDPLPASLVVYQFIDSDSALNELNEDVDFTLSGNAVTFSDAIRTALTEDRGYFSVRYDHHQQYYIMNVMHDVRNTRVLDGGVDKVEELPVQCLLKVAHYVDNPSDA